jgi:predicted metal-binding protein
MSLMNRSLKYKILNDRKKKDLKKITSNAGFNSKSNTENVEYRVCRSCKKIWHYEKFRKIWNGWPDTNGTRRQSRCKTCESQYQKNSKATDPARRLYKLARQRANKKKIGFNISIKYIESIWPKDNKCPITKKEFKDGAKYKNQWASLDRVRNDYGYIIGNVAIISYEANVLKSDLVDIDILKDLHEFITNFIKTTNVVTTGSNNPENIMPRWELRKKNYQKYLEIYGNIT